MIKWQDGESGDPAWPQGEKEGRKCLARDHLHTPRTALSSTLPPISPVQNYMQELRNCSTKEAEKERVDKELGKIRKKYTSEKSMSCEFSIIHGQPHTRHGRADPPEAVHPSPALPPPLTPPFSTHFHSL